MTHGLDILIELYQERFRLSFPRQPDSRSPSNGLEMPCHEMEFRPLISQTHNILAGPPRVNPKKKNPLPSLQESLKSHQSHSGCVGIYLHFALSKKFQERRVKMEAWGKSFRKKSSMCENLGSCRSLYHFYFPRNSPPPRGLKRRNHTALKRTCCTPFFHTMFFSIQCFSRGEKFRDMLDSP